MATTVQGSEWFVGAWIKVKTSTDEEITGQIFCYDNNVTNCIVLRCEHPDQPLATLPYASPKYNLRVIKTNFIREVTAIPVPSTQMPGLPNFVNVASLNLDRLESRERQAVRLVKASLAKIGVGVTQEAQDIFDALSKTLPCRWKKDVIIVLDEVTIHPPYDLEHCKDIKGESSPTLARVKKVLDGERRRLAQKHSNPASPAL